MSRNRSAIVRRLTKALYPDTKHLGSRVLEVFGSSPWLDPRDHEPKQALHGLSPAEARRLIEGDWDRNGPLRLNEGVTLDDLDAAPLFGNVRELMCALAEYGNVRAVDNGLDPRFGAALARRLPWFTAFAEPEVRHRDDGVTEMDYPAITVYRRLAQRLGLMRRNRRGFSLTERGRTLAEPGNAGRLYGTLLRACMFDSEIRERLYVAAGGEGPLGLVRGWAFPLWVLGNLDAEWRPDKDLALALAPPWSWEAAAFAYQEAVEITIALRFLHPLTDLGLVERPVPYGKVDGRGHIRRAALYHRVVRFDFGTNGPHPPWHAGFTA